MDVVWKILNDGEYITNLVEQRALASLNPYLRSLFNKKTTTLEWFFVSKVNLYSASCSYSSIFKECLIRGCLDIIEWLDDRYDNLDWSDWMTRICIEQGHIDILDWIYIKKQIHNIMDYEWYTRLAAENNQLNILKWAKNYNLLKLNKWDEFFIRAVGSKNTGNLETLQWGYQNGFIDKNHIFNQWTVESISNSGNTEVLTWLYNNKLIQH